eukprot:TRINITY_DN21707_c0_g1_i1.p1 TRINITY_DN21707_c0_g1~~TRINITY_DN21707_c0_g1_i1.p1  ORF type:complete len:238 (+),score=68.56 TRINITY_DN21707_c0_g1_i1:49-762(+)
MLGVPGTVVVPGTIPGHGLRFCSPTRTDDAAYSRVVHAAGGASPRRMPDLTPPRSRSPVGAAISPQPLALASASIAPADRARSPAAAAAAEEAERYLRSGNPPAVSGAALYVIRQRVEAEPPARPPTGPDGPVSVLGVYASREMAKFYMDRAVDEVAVRVRQAREQSEWAGVSKPEGASEDVWQQLRAAAQSTDMPRRETCPRAEMGYLWKYRRWKVTVSVWVERRIVDAPPTHSLW